MVKVEFEVVYAFDMLRVPSCIASHRFPLLLCPSSPSPVAPGPSLDKAAAGRIAVFESQIEAPPSSWLTHARSLRVRAPTRQFVRPTLYGFPFCLALRWHNGTGATRMRLT